MISCKLHLSPYIGIPITSSTRRASVKTMASSDLVATVDIFREKLGMLLTKPAPRYVVFSADLDATTQLPWCPDCVRTLPSIQAAVGACGGSLLEVRVGPRPAWKSPSHPFRLDPELRLQGIPTLVHVHGDGTMGERAGAQLERASGPEEAMQVVTAFIQQTKHS